MVVTPNLCVHVERGYRNWLTIQSVRAPTDARRGATSLSICHADFRQPHNSPIRLARVSPEVRGCCMSGLQPGSRLVSSPFPFDSSLPSLPSLDRINSEHHLTLHLTPSTPHTPYPQLNFHPPCPRSVHRHPPSKEDLEYNPSQTPRSTHQDKLSEAQHYARQFPFPHLPLPIKT